MTFSGVAMVAILGVNMQIVMLSSNFAWTLIRYVEFEKSLEAILFDPLCSYMVMPHYESQGHRVKIQTLSNIVILYTVRTEVLF